jgi:hypothetical protein
MDRSKRIEKHLHEFSAFPPDSKIHTAISNVLAKMPYRDFLNVTDRHRPVIFYDPAGSPVASSLEFVVTKEDGPCCQQGFTIIKIGAKLQEAKDLHTIEGVIAHELAHRVLDHIKRGKVNCASEREANQLIMRWGFGKEFKSASKEMGHREGDPKPCQE